MIMRHWKRRVARGLSGAVAGALAAGVFSCAPSATSYDEYWEQKLAEAPEPKDKVGIVDQYSVSGALPLANPYSCASTDLISGLTPVQTGHFINWTGGDWGVSDPSKLNDDVTFPETLTAFDGPWSGNATLPNYTRGAGYASSVTYALAAPSTITEIAVFAGLVNNAANGQNWMASYSTDNGSTFTDLPRVNWDPGTSPIVTKVTLTDSTGSLASNVTHIRFTFYGDWDTNPETGVYGEIDVLGAETAGISVDSPAGGESGTTAAVTTSRRGGRASPSQRRRGSTR